jgi:hypothetical protein
MKGLEQSEEDFRANKQYRIRGALIKLQKWLI